jgi:hypothetical protein
VKLVRLGQFRFAFIELSIVRLGFVGLGQFRFALFELSGLG